MVETSRTEPTCSTASALPEREWSKLLTLMGDGRVIPVIGPEMLCVPGEDGEVARLYDLWGMALAQQRGIKEGPRREETPLLYSVANQLSVNPETQPGDLEYELDGVIRGQRWPMPESLRLLADISDFPVYVTTTIDHLMVTALRQAAAAREAPVQIVFKRGGDMASCDLPRDFVPGKRPAVFHLFGATSTDPDGFAATEDALIEFSWALIDPEYAPKQLFDFLRRKTILLLGCDFPDWLGRFFVHALTRKQEAQIAVVYVSNCRQCGLHDFLRRKKARLFTPCSPTDFVEELHRRWQQQRRSATEPAVTRAETPPMPSRSKRGAVFISYAREDREAATAIRDQLEAAKIDTWMDESGLEPGVEFQYVIKENIGEASFFIAVISRALDLDGSDRPGRFVLREWHWAEDVNLERRKDDCFLRPVVVDDTPPHSPFLERPFRDLHWTRLQEGRLPLEFIEGLKRGIRRFRSSSGRGGQ